MANITARALKNTISKNADDVIKGSRNVINLSSNSYKITDAIMPKSGNFTKRPIRSGNFTTSAKGPIIVEPTPAIEGPILKAKSGNFTTDSRDYKIARNRERNAERQQRIANNRGSNEAKMIDNKVMNMDSRQPLMLESKEAKVEKAFNMLNDGQEEVAEKILDSFSVGGTEPYRKKSEQEIRRKKEAHNNAMHNQVGSIPNEKPVTNRTSQPRVASQAGGDESAKNLTDKVKGNNFVYNMASLGVGGGLVLNMANNKGQQSNAQLYGQY